MTDGSPGIFEDLPEALVSDMLDNTNAVGDKLLKSFREVNSKKEVMRKKLTELGLVKNANELIVTTTPPTTCAVDGSYSIERLVSTDFAACAAVAVEGLTPPSNEKFWQKPRHIPFILPIIHNDANTVVLRALMMTMELELAQKASHGVVFMDGSLLTPLIYMNQGLEKVDYVSGEIADKLCDRIEIALTAYKEIITSPKAHQIFAGLPKYSDKREIGSILGLPNAYDDKALLSLVLKAGEFVGPIDMATDGQYHLTLPKRLAKLTDLKNDFLNIANNKQHLKILYFKPKDWMSALRIEVPEPVVQNKHRLANLLYGVLYQCASPTIMEPFPQYMADRMVKHLSVAVPSIRRAVMQRMIAQETEVSSSDIFTLMHSYRT